MNQNLRWQKGNGRYYKIHLQKDMLGYWTLTCAWGGINSRLGNYRSFVFAEYAKAKLMINDIIVKREKRGYFLINT